MQGAVLIADARGLHPSNLDTAIAEQDRYYGRTKPMIFVFGSNEAGRHGAGAARTAYREHGAQMGVGYGHTGDSFAVPTLDGNLKPLNVDWQNRYVSGFINYALENPNLNFKVTRIGCGLAGMRDCDMAPLFRAAPRNCCFDTAWKPWLGEHAKYWGTF